MSRRCRVAVIGAGVSGLAAARELLRHGHSVAVFEKADRLGGTWVYDPRTESDPAARDPSRTVVHSSLYRSLRTNLPRQIMGFVDYPFPEAAKSYGDPRTFPSHEEVLAFVEEFARDAGMGGSIIRLGAEVVRVAPPGAEGGGPWEVEWRDVASGSVAAEAFEAVVVCSGNHTQPRLAEIPGMERWRGKEIHSHNYRTPEPYQGQTVVLIGRGASAYDISNEISRLAKEVHVVSRSADDKVTKLTGHDNIWQHSMIKCISEDGFVMFHDGTSLAADVIFHCTGYNYHFPFLECNELVSVDDNRVGPLYKHVFPPGWAPCLSFVGITSKTISILTIDLQAKWVAKVLSGKTKLPNKEEMLSTVEELYLSMEKTGKPKHHTHELYPNELEYMNWLAAEMGLEPIEDWRDEMFNCAIKGLVFDTDGYRDAWDDDYWNQKINSAHQRIQQLIEGKANSVQEGA